jgi:PAS domain S-box-containing protein
MTSDLTPEDFVRSALIGEALERAGYVVLVADDTMQFLTASDGACELLGYTREELTRMRVPQIVQDADAPTRYAQMIDEREQYGQVTLLHKSGDRIPAAYKAAETKVGELTYYVSVLRPL